MPFRFACHSFCQPCFSALPVSLAFQLFGPAFRTLKLCLSALAMPFNCAFQLCLSALPYSLAFQCCFLLYRWDYRHDTRLESAHFHRHRSVTGGKKQYLTTPGQSPGGSPLPAGGSRHKEGAEHHRGIDKSNPVAAAVGKVSLSCPILPQPALPYTCPIALHLFALFCPAQRYTCPAVPCLTPALPYLSCPALRAPYLTRALAHGKSCSTHVPQDVNDCRLQLQ